MPCSGNVRQLWIVCFFKTEDWLTVFSNELQQSIEIVIWEYIGSIFTIEKHLVFIHGAKKYI